MLKKLGLGLMVMLLSAIAFGSTSVENKNDKDFPLDYDPFANIIGYHEAEKGGGFPPAMSEIINQFGKVPTVRFATSNKELIKITNNVSISSQKGFPTIYIIDTRENKTVVVNTQKYEVSYYVSDGYFYASQIVLKYDQKYSPEEQADFLSGKVQNYLTDAGFEDDSPWAIFGTKKTYKYKKDNIEITYVNSTRGSDKGLTITIVNKKVAAKAQENNAKVYNTEFKDKFKEVDGFLK